MEVDGWASCFEQGTPHRCKIRCQRFCFLDAAAGRAYEFPGKYIICMSGRNQRKPCIAALRSGGSTDSSPWFRSSSATLLCKVRRYPLSQPSEMSDGRTSNSCKQRARHPESHQEVRETVCQRAALREDIHAIEDSANVLCLMIVTWYVAAIGV